MFQRIPGVILTGVFLVVLSGLSLAAPKVDLATRAEVQRTVLNDKGEQVVVMVHAAKADVVPGDVVIFTTTYRNLGTEATDPGLVIDNPVPEHMEYVEKSSAGNNMTITYSVDGGKSFDVPSGLYVTDKDGKRRKARPADYTSIRWTMVKPLAPAVVGTVSFRAKVK